MQNLPSHSLIIIFGFVWDKNSLYVQLSTRKSLNKFSESAPCLWIVFLSIWGSEVFVH